MTACVFASPNDPDDRERRAAIAARDARYDGRFVYAVATTSVYCRPSCPARRPRPENVVLFDDAVAAADAGYRACKRCRPDKSEAARLDAAARAIAARPEESWTLARLAELAGMPVPRFRRRFRERFGSSPKAAHAAARAEAFKAGLKAGESVAAAGYDAGYSSMSRIHAATARLGMTASAYRSGAAGETIACAAVETDFGAMLIGATDVGVCYAQFGADPAMLEREFPHARLAAAEGSPALAAWTLALRTFLSDGGPHPDVPLDLRGTAFQLAAWRALTAIKPGETISYTELACRIGRPSAVRAAASACARNRIAVLAPCHRVLRGDGSPGGYRWGVDVKRALLEHEAKAVNPPASTGRASP